MTFLCSFNGCGSTKKGPKGLCPKHYKRLNKYGDPSIIKSPRGEAQRFYEDVVLKYEGEECLIWPYGKAHGYGRIQRDRRVGTVSRLVCIDVHGEPPTSLHEAAHSCGRGSAGCVAKSHLSWKTRAENQADRLLHGTHNRGERQGAAKLTESDVEKIRALTGRQFQSVTAKAFGVTQQTISRVQRNATWFGVPERNKQQGI